MLPPLLGVEVTPVEPAWLHEPVAIRSLVAERLAEIGGVWLRPADSGTSRNRRSGCASGALGDRPRVS